MPRIVITGVGAVTPLGLGASTTFDGWLAGEVALLSYDAFDPSLFMTGQEIRRADRFTQLTIAAAHEAIEQAGWSDGPPVAPERVGCVIATSVGGIETVESEYETLLRRGPKRLSPFGPPRLMPNAAAAMLAIRYGLLGESYGLCSACASGTQSIGAGVRMLRSGEADAMIVGGADAHGTPLMLAMLEVMGATSSTGTVRPFDRRRDGFMPSEGAAVLVLEREEVAQARGAEILGEVLSYAASTDAHSMTSPHPEGRGAAQAMRTALELAGLGPADVDYINAHGTSTKLNDRIETAAIKAVFGPDAWRIPISTTKSAVGHLGGGAGSLEAVMTLLTLQRGVVAPTLGLEQPDDELDLDFVPDGPRALSPANGSDRLVGMSNSFGFGGHNATVVLAATPTEPA